MSCVGKNEEEYVAMLSISLFMKDRCTLDASRVSISFPSSKMLPLDSKRSFKIVSSILCQESENENEHLLRKFLCYLEFCLGFVDVDNEFISLLLEIRSLQSHYITVDTNIEKEPHRTQY